MPKKPATKSKRVTDIARAEVRMPQTATPLGESVHLRSLKPIPAEADSNPVEWADKHLEKLVPLAAKEKEWQLKFGNDAARDKVASELLAMRSISAKKEAGVNVAAVINLVPFENPWARTKQLPKPQDDTQPGQHPDYEDAEIVK